MKSGIDLKHYGKKIQRISWERFSLIITPQLGTKVQITGKMAQTDRPWIFTCLNTNCDHSFANTRYRLGQKFSGCLPFKFTLVGLISCDGLLYFSNAYLPSVNLGSYWYISSMADSKYPSHHPTTRTRSVPISYYLYLHGFVRLCSLPIYECYFDAIDT